MKVNITASKTKLNLAGFRELRTCPGARQMVEQAARKIADACGSGYVAEESPSRTRARQTVYPDTVEAQIDDLKHLTLVNHIGAGRG